LGRNVLNAKNLNCPVCAGAELVTRPYTQGEVTNWRWNPGLVINELALGQRIPIDVLMCPTCDLPEYERLYVFCASCGTPNRPTALKRFGNWSGLGCPGCGADLPCLRNVYAEGLTRMTSPIWRPLYLSWRRHNGPRQPSRARISTTMKTPSRPFLRAGIRFGVGTWILACALPAGLMWTWSHNLRWDYIVQMTVLSIVAGTVFGLAMHHRLGRKPHSR
jgi:hypothetical protein